MVRHLFREKDMCTLRALIEKCSQFAFSLSSAATVISAFRNKRLPSNLVYTLLQLQRKYPDPVKNLRVDAQTVSAKNQEEVDGSSKRDAVRSQISVADVLLVATAPFPNDSLDATPVFLP